MTSASDTSSSSPPLSVPSSGDPATGAEVTSLLDGLTYTGHGGNFDSIALAT